MPGRGGKREGAGRKPGGVNKMSSRAREEAAKTGELPHELLLRVARGDSFSGHRPSFQERFNAMKAILPVYSARLAAVDRALPDEFIAHLVEAVGRDAKRFCERKGPPENSDERSRYPKMQAVTRALPSPHRERTGSSDA